MIIKYYLNSEEKLFQAERESRTLMAIYFSQHTIPDSPEEPDPEYSEFVEPKIIPLEKNQVNIVSDKKEEPVNVPSNELEVLPSVKKVSSNR